MNIAIILSGGVGSRMGLNQPKQYVIVNNQPVINYCITAFLENYNTDAIVIGVADEWKDFVVENVAKLHPAKPIFYAPAGETRQYTIYNCLKKVKECEYSDKDIVIIHDAARPLLTHDLINRCYEGCKNADCIMPVIGVKDTVYLSENGKNITSLLNRNHLWAGQAPESFVFGKYLKLHDKMPREDLLKINGSTELAFKCGLNCQMIEGDPMNFKITTMEDLSNFEAIVKNRKIR